MDCSSLSRRVAPGPSPDVAPRSPSAKRSANAGDKTKRTLRGKSITRTLGICPLDAKRFAQVRENAVPSFYPKFDARLAGGPGIPLVLGDPRLVDALRQERHEQRSLALAGVIEPVALHDRGRHERVRLDPVERVVGSRLLLIIVGHRFRAPPSLAAFRLEEGEDR